MVHFPCPVWLMGCRSRTMIYGVLIPDLVVVFIMPWRIGKKENNICLGNTRFVL
jgi:hypothetical protein